MVHKHHFRDDGTVFAVSNIVRFENNRETLVIAGIGDWVVVKPSAFATVEEAQAAEAELMAHKGHQCTRECREARF